MLPNIKTSICSQNNVLNLGHRTKICHDHELNAGMRPVTFELRLQGELIQNSQVIIQNPLCAQVQQCKKQPFLCDCFRQQLLKNDAEGTEKVSDIDIRRGMENAPLTSLRKGAIYFLNWLLQ